MPTPKKTTCECNEPATTTNSAGEKVCQVCRDIERRGKEIHQHYANHGRRVSTAVDTEDAPEPPSTIAADAIARLERMLEGA